MLALVQFFPWDRPYAFKPRDLSVQAGDFVVANTEYGQEIGQVRALTDSLPEGTQEGEIKTIERPATSEDMEIFGRLNNPRHKAEAIADCHKIIKRHSLEMKIADCQFSLDDNRLVFAFIADGRVDFRSALKDLNKHFERSIRLHQLGVRDEAKATGDIGSCGLDLCCRSHLQVLGNVSSEFAEKQQIAHRGPERLSGVCGRLKCCLAYEAPLYEELGQKLPAIGTRVRTKHGRGVVSGWHTLRGSVDVRIDAESEKEGERGLVVEVPIK